MISRRKGKIIGLMAAASLLLLASCELPVEGGEYEERLVVFGHLTADAPIMDTVTVSLTYEISESHEAQAKWLADAMVTLSDGEESFDLSPVAGRPGRYLDASFPPHLIRPATTYDLTVEWEDYRVNASTTVPDTFLLSSNLSTEWTCEGQPVEVPAIDLHEDDNDPLVIQYALMTGDYSLLAMDTVMYREGPCHSTSFMSVPLFVVEWLADSTAGVVQIMTLALDDTVTNAIVDTSLAALAFKGFMEEDEDGNLYRSGLFSWNSSIRQIPFNWLFFNYYGPHLITIQVTDENLRKYFEGNPGGFNPFISPNSTVEGGYGLFYSSYARTFFVHIAPDTSVGVI